MKVQLILTIVITALECVIYGGIVYGWASLEPVLIKEGFFSTSSSCSNTTNISCPHQTEQLSLVFTIATAVGPVMSLVFGYCLDRYGNWYTRTLILSILLIGLLLTASATPANSWVLFLSFSLCNFASFGLIISNTAIGNLHPTYRSSIVTLMSGSFDSSTLVFLVFRKIYELGVSFQTMFYVYAACIAFFMVHTFFLTPKRVAPFVPPEDYMYGYKELKLCNSKYSSIDEDNVINNDMEYQDHDNSEHRTLKNCFLDIYTWTELIHYGVSNLAASIFIANFHTWITTKVDENHVEQYTTVFGAMQGLGIFIAPISGLLIDFSRRRFSQTLGSYLGSLKSVTVMLFVTDFVIITMLLCSLVPNSQLQLLTMALQVLGKSFVCATAGAFVNALYPTKHYGFIYGITLGTGSAFLLLQYPVTLLLTRVLDNNFLIVNLVMLCLCLINLLHPIYLMWYIQNKATGQ